MRKRIFASNRQGFTLIELLVVIVIIGLLASLAVISMSSARNKANDAKVRSDLDQIRKSIMADLSEGGTYEAAAIPVNFAPPSCSGDAQYTLATSTDGQDFAIAGQLCANSDAIFCLDSAGKSFEGSTTLATIITDAACPATP
ncbi:MAG: prepilin-type N-terminal cleavage/methylation domain-containing protein [Patescibacteria group bacterium]